MAVDVASTIELRPYQEECVSLVLAAYKENPSGRELLVLPTGSGKTLVFSSVIHSLAREYGLNALIIAHRDELLQQAADKYRMIQPDAIIGKVGSGIHQYGGEVTVASIATISRPEHLKHLKALYGTGRRLIIIVDEAHHQAARGYQVVLEALSDAFVLSVTATPDRLDGKDISDKPPLYQATILDMIKNGYLCDVKAIAIRTDVQLADIKTTAGDYNEHELDLAVNTPQRNRRVVEGYLEHTPGKRGIFFCVTVAHAEALAYTFNDMGIPAAHIEGDRNVMPLEERQRRYKALRTGEIKVLTNVGVLTEGYDEPLIEVIGMARPTQSRSLYTQAVGRGLRLAPGKKYCTILDITDNCLRLRLTPQNFSSVIGMYLKFDQTLLASLAREEDEKAEREAAEKRALIRKLNEKRDKDVIVNLFGLPDWQERDGGMFVLEVGPMRHRIALVPRESMGWAQLYDVYARLAPTFAGQRWASGQTLDGAMQIAEKKARQLLDGKSVLVDQSAPWRLEQPSEGQKKYLAWKKLPMHEGMTKGEAADLIDKHKQMLEQKKAEKEARKAAKEEQVSA